MGESLDNSHSCGLAAWVALPPQAQVVLMEPVGSEHYFAVK